MTQGTDNVEEVFSAKMEAEQQQLHGVQITESIFRIFCLP